MVDTVVFFRKQEPEVFKTYLTREEVARYASDKRTVRLIFASERRNEDPHKRDELDDRHNYQDRISNYEADTAVPALTAVFFSIITHWKVSSSLYALLRLYVISVIVAVMMNVKIPMTAPVLYIPLSIVTLYSHVTSRSVPPA